jgi:acetyltransferase-like isoleucine patch superfamily enzyme
MIDVIIITYNEAINLPYCLRALQGWTRKVFVVDSGSTDATPEIAKSMGAEFVHHDWPGYARQKNWALDTLPIEAEWVLIVDADEVITSEVRARLEEIDAKPVDEVKENGFFINRLTYFTGRPIRHCGYFPSWNLRFFKRGTGRYEDREVHEHIVINDPVGYIKEWMIHDDRRGLEHYAAKHNRYSTLEARALFKDLTQGVPRAEVVNVSKDARRHRWLKRHILPHLPAPGMWRFVYVYFLRLGILDGRTGLEFCKFIGMYDSMVALKLRTLRRDAADRFRGEAELEEDVPYVSGLAVGEGSDPVSAHAASDAEALAKGRKPERVPGQLQPERSPYTFKEKLGRAIWMLFGRLVFRATFHNWYGFRTRWLRLFGAKIGRGVAIRPTVNIEIPWMLEIEDGATVGDHAILYCLGTIKIGRRSIVSQYAHLCAGTHDYSDHTFKLLRTPITIGDDVWIGADSFVGPGVTVGRLAVVGARSSVYKPVEGGAVYVGNPARRVKERVLR